MNVNQLIYEKSPYLLAHARQPIAWFAWGEEVFAQAHAQQKPIFLSIGYSSCHWCHVMARESFEDEEIARILNEHFLAIKVDREERPDIDAVYLQVCQEINGSAGWPLTVVMTPDQKPFFVGTYFPKNSSAGQSGLKEILKLFSAKWQENKKELWEIGTRIQEFFLNADAEESPALSDEGIEAIANFYQNAFDLKYGGFQGAPKFPPFSVMRFFLHKLRNNEKITNWLELTLHALASSGLYDQIEGGFFRYATDDKWLIPHFEKMLYDNALAIITYIEASFAAIDKTNKKIYLRIAQKTFDFLMKRFYQGGQGFFASSNAESNGEEGVYYLWRQSEIYDNFPQYKDFITTFQITENGQFSGKSLPHYSELKLPKEGFNSDALGHLGAYRHQRYSLAIDQKIITTWNCLMVVALARLYQSQKSGREQLFALAEEIIEFIEEHIINAQGRLGTCFIDGKVSGDGFLDDYAYLGYAYLTMYELSQDAKYLEKLLHILDLTIENFFDQETGGFYLNANFSERLLYRPKPSGDNSIPSGNSILLLLLQKVSLLVPTAYYRNLSELHLNYLKKTWAAAPTDSPFALLAYERAERPFIVYRTAGNNYQRILKFVNENPLLNPTLLVLSKDNLAILNRYFNYNDLYPLHEKKSTFYLCLNKVCLPPQTDILVVKQLLKH